jgi:hypothetical protein
MGNRKINLMVLGLLFLCNPLFNASCSAQQPGFDTSGRVIDSNESYSSDSSIASMTLSKDELTKIYVQAIDEFIKTVSTKNNIAFDTLYFGKRKYGQPDDFPDIELPTTIGKTQIRLVNPTFGEKIQRERRNLVYVNLMGWVEKEKADFIFVVFTNGFVHQFDYYLYFSWVDSTKKFELDKIDVENYKLVESQKSERVTIYSRKK